MTHCALIRASLAGYPAALPERGATKYPASASAGSQAVEPGPWSPIRQKGRRSIELLLGEGLLGLADERAQLRIGHDAPRSGQGRLGGVGGEAGEEGHWEGGHEGRRA